MRLDPSTLLSLAAACAPQVSPDTLLSVVRVESGLDPLAIGINGPGRQRLSPANPDAAVRTAEALLKQGRNFDLGLAQINVRNLSWLGLGLADAFDPCRNLAASAKVLVADWRRSTSATSSSAAALGATLSLYNTGDVGRGYRNGYVAKVAAAGRSPIAAPTLAAPTLAAPTLAAAPPASQPSPPGWAVFGQARATVSFVISPAEGATP